LFDLAASFYPSTIQSTAMLTSYSTAYLKQLTSPVANVPLLNQALAAGRPVVIGRDPACQIVLDSQYQSVSKQHLEIRSIATSPQVVWQISDLGSSNGTYVNGQRLQGQQVLNHGDRIRLGKNGPEFGFECLSAASARLPGGAIAPHLGDMLGPSEVIPILSKDFFRKSYFVPGIVTVVFAVLLFSNVGASDSTCSTVFINPFGFPLSCYNILLGQYLSLVAFYVVYLQCGKSKPWWVLVGACLLTVFILQTSLEPFLYVFRTVLPGDTAPLKQQLEQGLPVNSVEWFIRMFFGAGLMEELLKAVPIFLALYIGRKMNSPQREQIGVWEPLDGILLGAASAVGFILPETLGQYVPEIIQRSGETAGVALLIPRIVGSIAGHIAYSGYFGYFIGLAVLKPQQRWKLLGIGYLTAAVVHALWNSVLIVAQTPGAYIFLQSLVGIISYMLLMAAIVRARRISPNRAQNFATQVRPYR
jgi:RsiW-degrading membrane proteinase PrsW (M82 family)